MSLNTILLEYLCETPDWSKITMGHTEGLIGPWNCACDGELLIGWG